jgi:competence protein ComGC
MKRNKKSGFTLVEVFVVVVIIMLIAVVAGGCGLVLKGCKTVQEEGIKGIAETVWDGTGTEEENDTGVVETDSGTSTN